LDVGTVYVFFPVPNHLLSFSMKFARISSGADALPATASTRIKLENLLRWKPLP
jgi:hypothetical protein